MVDRPAQVCKVTHMSTTPNRLLNLTPVTLFTPAVGAVRIARRSEGSDGNSADGLACAIRRAISAGHSHVEAADVITGERYYLPVGQVA